MGADRITRRACEVSNADNILFVLQSWRANLDPYSRRTELPSHFYTVLLDPNSGCTDVLEL